MINLPQKVEKRPLETSISLINIVFLMLIFFLVAGQLAPPQDPDVVLSKSEDAPPLPPPDALYVRKDGSLVYRDKTTTAADYFLVHRETAEGESEPVRLGADAELPAKKLLDHVAALYSAGASNVVIITRKNAE